jgi:hypothetical protein
MAEAASDYQQHEDYWKPLPGPRLQTDTVAESTRARCSRCRAELPFSAKYCQACGFQQTPTPIKVPTLFNQHNLASLVAALEQNIASFITLVLGCSCLLAGVATGFLFKVNTLSDWQAVQLWRIEWLLGAIALFTAGILLKRLAKKP